jgi:CRISPR/Cas system type I-B associated protein Csh2 (Cas7 group RAMP superfamily)
VRAGLIGAAVIITVMGVTTQRFMEWKSFENERKEALCRSVQQHMKTLETRARAMTAGLSMEAYAEAESSEVDELVSALDTANNDAEVEAVIDAHAAKLEAKDAATDAELKNLGSQHFLEQQLKEQRITTDIKQEIKRTEKAVTESCN